jgi:chromatin remodeling complex protein RSC6
MQVLYGREKRIKPYSMGRNKKYAKTWRMALNNNKKKNVHSFRGTKEKRMSDTIGSGKLVRSGRPDGSEVVGVEDSQPFEEQAQPPGNGRQPAGDGRRKSDTMEFITTIGKQAFDFKWGHTARLRVNGVEPEVI